PARRRCRAGSRTRGCAASRPDYRSRLGSSPFVRSVMADDPDPPETPSLQILKLPSKVLSLQLEEHHMALAAIFARTLEDGGKMRRVLVEDDGQPIRSVGTGDRPFGQNTDHALEADRESRRRHVAAQQPADHAVVAAAAGDGSRAGRVPDL